MNKQVYYFKLTCLKSTFIDTKLHLIEEGTFGPVLSTSPQNHDHQNHPLYKIQIPQSTYTIKNSNKEQL